MPLKLSAHGERVAMSEVVLHLEHVVAARVAAMHIADPDRLEGQSHRDMENGEPQPLATGCSGPAAHAFIDALFARAQTVRRPTQSRVRQQREFRLFDGHAHVMGVSSGADRCSSCAAR